MTQMSDTDSQTNFATSMPRWQVVLMLVGFPVLYLINSFLPWSKGLFGNKDHSYFLHFWISVAVLHWLSFLVAAILIKRSGGALSDITGFHFSPRKIAGILAVLLIISVSLIFVRQTWPPDRLPPGLAAWQAMFPATLIERSFWIFMCLTAGFCEEFVYRGFGITVLRGKGLRLWQAVILATLSFIFVHGLGGLFAFPFFFLSGLLFSAIYLWRKSLLPGILLHVIMDFGALLAI